MKAHQFQKSRQCRGQHSCKHSFGQCVPWRLGPPAGETDGTLFASSHGRFGVRNNVPWNVPLSGGWPTKRSWRSCVQCRPTGQLCGSQLVSNLWSFCRRQNAMLFLGSLMRIKSERRTAGLASRRQPRRLTRGTSSKVSLLRTSSGQQYRNLSRRQKRQPWQPELVMTSPSPSVTCSSFTMGGKVWRATICLETLSFTRSTWSS
mmetsp:Transcript_43268/g.113847  ORF Transcript_43268/g.113847 Transcript_43268/m.113847 type:complete len:204 (-) Transcript_43268:2167-2778(-)